MREHAQHSFQYVKHASTHSVTTLSIQMIHKAAAAAMVHCFLGSQLHR